MYFQLYLLVLLLASFVRGDTHYFDVNKVIEISLSDSDKVEGSYFGYSLLLQKGKKPMVIVGAPKQNKTGGAVFGCNIFNGFGCTKYDIATSNLGSFNGNFLGSVIDGSDETGSPFVVCAPRRVTQHGTGVNMNYYLKGTCFYQTNSTSFIGNALELAPFKNEVPISNAEGQYYYDYGFGQAGIDAVYNKDSLSSVLLGAPGIKNWNGGVVAQSLQTLSRHQIIPERDAPQITEAYDYLGYKVDYGIEHIYAGAPRAQNLFGKVNSYSNSKLYKSFVGTEMGGFYGSAILVEDVNGDGIDDLFIGAPTTAGSSYDEGCVFYYVNAQSNNHILVGRKSSGARFGTNIVSLGDIDLNLFNDIAISAPYEDDGAGAVYIFMGGPTGLNTYYSQRLSPSSFQGNLVNIRGFGMGISRGNDIDGNGHNDLAIGAYKSGHVIIIPSKCVIDFRTALKSNVTAITSTDPQVSIKYCVYFKPRSKTFSHVVNFMMRLELDERVKGQKLYLDNVTAFVESTKCMNIDVNIESTIVDTTPFRFMLRTTVSENVIAEGTTQLDRTIPYAHGCGEDNICQTRLLLNIKTDTDNIILGLTKSINLKLTAENNGEPGYQCKLLMEIPKGLKLQEDRKCTFENENSTYSCLFATNIPNKQKQTMKIGFDVLDISNDLKFLELTFEVKCLGENVDNKDFLPIEVKTLNTPYIDGKSDPENYEISDETTGEENEIEMHHIFTLGNFGPSPVKSDICLMLPVVKIDNEDIFKFVEAKGNLRGSNIQCSPSNRTKNFKKRFDVSTVVKAASNRTVILNCFDENSECQEFICKGDYVYKSSETAKFILKFKTKNKSLAKFFEKQEQSKNIAAYISTAYLLSDLNILGHSATLFFSSHSKNVPLWVYIVSSISGILLLALLIFVFYKCHFFDRRYRDKMNDELLMQMEMHPDVPAGSDEDIKEEISEEIK